MRLFTRAWWEAAGQRAGYTALAALLPLSALLVTGQVTPVYALSFTAAAAATSLATSAAGLPEVADRTIPLWRAIVVRAVKTAAQVALPALVAVELLEQIGWSELGVQVAGATLTTLVRTLMAWLPESARELHDTVVVPDGVAVITGLTQGEVENMRSLHDALEPGDPSRAVLDRILGSRVPS